MKNWILIFSLFSQLLWAQDRSARMGARVTSPYEACENQHIISKANESSWKGAEEGCQRQAKFIDDTGFMAIDPLKEGVEYLNFSQKVAHKVLQNLKKSQNYAICSANCFKGDAICSASLGVDKKVVDCAERKKEVLQGLKVNARKIRMELALSSDAPGLLNVNVRNVLQVDKNNRINTDLRDFEIGTPNPLGRSDLTPGEFAEALRRLERDQNKLENEFKDKGYKNYHDWMSVKLMDQYDEHRARYRSLIYEEAPIFAVIEKPAKFERGSDPVWKDQQIAKAFNKLSENAELTQQKVQLSLEKGKLEFSRANGEAIGNWVASLAPGATERHDLLFYMRMKNQVDEVLKVDPSYCGIATAMETRLHSKELQNAGVSIVAFLPSAVIAKGGSSAVSSIFRVGRALSGSEAAGLTGMSMGAAFLGDSFIRYNSGVNDATTLSGLDQGQEGTSLIKSEEIESARNAVKLSLAFTSVGVGPNLTLGRNLYRSSSNRVANGLTSGTTLVNGSKHSSKKVYLKFEPNNGEVSKIGGKAQGLVKSPKRVGLEVVTKDISENESKAAYAVVEGFYDDIGKNTQLRVPDHMKVHIRNSFEFGEEGVQFPLTYGGKEGAVETQAGIYHELGHTIFSSNIKNAEGKYKSEMIEELSRTKANLRKQQELLENELKQLGFNRNDDALMQKVQRKQEELKEVKQSIQSLNYGLRNAYRSFLQYDELVADLTSTVMTKDVSAMVTHIKRSNVGNVRLEKAMPYFNQRAFSSQEGKVIYFDSSFSQALDDPYASLQHFRWHLYKNYLSNPVYKGKEYQILEKVVEASKFEVLKKRSGYKDLNLGLIKQFDDLMGQKNPLADLEDIRHVNGRELME